MQTHASLPMALRLDHESYRAYFAPRDINNRPYVGYIELNLKSPKEIVALSNEPVLAPGPVGNFDSHGVYPASIVEYDKGLFMYYIGWNPGVRAPLFYSSIGWAINEDKERTFKKTSPAPIMTTSEFDLCLVPSPYVLLDGGVRRMWYISGFKWEREDKELHSYYHIKYAESKEEIHWERNGLVCIGLLSGERNIGRPCAIKEDTYKMWYSYNFGQGYRMGYAESRDGYICKRMDAEAGIDVSPMGWDSEAIANPWVFTHNERKYILHNGNDFGKDGFGLALED